MFESADPIALYAHDKALFGELAERAEFEALLREKIAAVYPMIQ
jgi:D-arabinitol 4-dehydrogenase